MELKLDLINVPKEFRLDFCNYLIIQIKNNIYETNEQSRYNNMEKYINSNNLISWITNKNQFISVYDLYKLGVNNLKIRQVDEDKYEIYIDQNENIPNSYTNLYSIISLLEYGTLSVQKCGTLTKTVGFIIDKLDTYYNKFLMENK